MSGDYTISCVQIPRFCFKAERFVPWHGLPVVFLSHSVSTVQSVNFYSHHLPRCYKTHKKRSAEIEKLIASQLLELSQLLGKQTFITEFTKYPITVPYSEKDKYFTSCSWHHIYGCFKKEYQDTNWIPLHQEKLQRM